MTRLHPRTQLVQTASSEIQLSINKLATQYNLTNVELLLILNTAAGSVVKHELRYERHGKIDKKADEA